MIVLMGVSGTGKSTIGKILAERLGAIFYEGDDFHSAAAIAKMQAGQPLTDEDRAPWLERLAEQLKCGVDSGRNIVMACSALKESYRVVLSSACPSARFVFLEGSRQLLQERLRQRQGHFFDPKLLDSQLATLEVPRGVTSICVNQCPESIVEAVMAQLTCCGS